MYVIKCRELLDAHVINERQKNVELSVRIGHCFSLDFWDLFFFTLLYILSFCHTSFCPKEDIKFYRKKEIVEDLREEKEWFFVCYLLEIYYSFNSIIHWIEWTHSMHMQWWSKPFNKVEILVSNWPSIWSYTSSIEYKRAALKDNNISPVGICLLKLTIEKLEQDVKYVQI